MKHIKVDLAPIAVMADLKQTFNVQTNAQVVRRALALARVFAANSCMEHTVAIISPLGKRIIVHLSE